MKTFLLHFILVLIPFHVFANTADVERYTFNTKLDPVNNELFVVVDLKIIKNVEDSNSSFIFNSKSKIQDIHLNNENKTTKLQFQQSEDNTLTIYLPQKDTVNLTLKYSFKTIPKDNGELIFRREEKWYPFNYNDIASYSLTSELHENYNVIGQQETPILTHSIPILYLPKNAYKHTVQNCKNFLVDYYFSSDDSTTINKIKEQVCNSFTFYNNYIGDYNFKTLSYVELSDFKAAQSLSTMVLFGSIFFEYYNYEGWCNWPSHELAHQWIGNSVFIPFENTIGRSFIEESLTEYLKKMYIENEFGQDSLLAQLRYDSAFYHPIVNTDKDMSIIKINNVSTKENAIIAYRKGPILYHKLRTLMGDQKWKELIENIYSNYQGKSFSFYDFHALLTDSVTDSTILEKFDNDIMSLGFEFMEK